MTSSLWTGPIAGFGIWDLSIATTECVPSTFGFHPEIVPSSVANMNTDDPVLVPSVILKPDVTGLCTWPVGLEFIKFDGGDNGGAIVTTSACFTQAPL